MDYFGLCAAELDTHAHYIDNGNRHCYRHNQRHAVKLGNAVHHHVCDTVVQRVSVEHCLGNAHTYAHGVREHIAIEFQHTNNLPNLHVQLHAIDGQLDAKPKQQQLALGHPVAESEQHQHGKRQHITQHRPTGRR